jgi:hypothetical protein
MSRCQQRRSFSMQRLSPSNSHVRALAQHRSTITALGAFVATAMAASARAQTTFSIDYKGPTVAGPATPADILMPAGGIPAFGPLPPPVIAITAGPPGLAIPTFGACAATPPGVPCPLEVDALSYGTDGPAMPGMPPGRWYFSVSRESVGIPTPIAPSVFSEAGTMEVAADIFIDMGLPPAPVPPFFGANVGVIDGNGVAGPSPFAYPGLGLVEPHIPCAPVNPGDNVDALDVDGPIGPIAYFSLDAAGPDACGIPRPGAGPANGFLPGAILGKAVGALAPIFVYAPPAALGLDLAGPGTDDLDALALFNNAVAGFAPSPGPYVGYGGAFDMVMFSVSPTSAVVGALDSLQGLPIMPGDILIPPVAPAFGGNGLPTPGIFIAAEAIGLTTVRSGFAASANLDGLDIARLPLFDCNGNGIEDALDLALGGADCNGNGILDTCEYAISTYCPTGVTTNGCTPSMTTAGTPTASLACPFSMTVTSVEGAKSGIIFYGVSGAAALPWGGGSFLCVKAPYQRTGAQVSGGTAGLCDGTLFLDFNAYMTANPTAMGQPLFPGEGFWFQGWFRDPPSAKTTAMSNALTFTLAP